MPEIISNFKFKSRKPNFDRDQLHTLEDLRNAKITDYDDGHIVYCTGSKRHYYFDSSSKRNETGYFRQLNMYGDEEQQPTINTKSVFIFCSTANQQDQMSVPEIPHGNYNFSWDVENDLIISPEYPNDYKGIKWTLGDEDSLEPPTWMCYGTIKYDDPENPVWGTPMLMSVGAGDGVDTENVEYIYKRTLKEDRIKYNSGDIQYIDNGQPRKPAASDVAGHVPSDWTNHPQGVGYIQQTTIDDIILYECEWVMVRYYNVVKEFNENGEKVDVLDENGEPKRAWTDWRGEILKDEQGNYVTLKDEQGNDLYDIDGQLLYMHIPALWSKYGVNGKDGDGIEYIYTCNHTGEVPELIVPENWMTNEEYQSREKEYIPNGWEDDPIEATADNEYVWVSSRKYRWSEELKKSIWFPFGQPTLWNKYSKSGQFTSYVFARRNGTQEELNKVTPIGGSYASPMPEYYGPTNYVNVGDLIPNTENTQVWFDTIPDGSEQVWMSFHVFDPETDNKNSLDNFIVWSTPQLMSDTSDFEVIYSPLEDPFDPNKIQNGVCIKDADGVELDPDYAKELKDAGWYDDPNYDVDENGKMPETIWMATNTLKSGVWKGWKVSKIKGEKGETGTSISLAGSYKYVYESEAQQDGNPSTEEKANSLEYAWRENMMPRNNPPQVGECYMVQGNCWVCQLGLSGLNGKDYTEWDENHELFVELEVVWENAGVIQGAPGNGIAEQIIQYCVTENNTYTDDELRAMTWYKDSPATTPKFKYLWRWTQILYDNPIDENKFLEFFEIIGTYGDRGIDGESIEYIYKLTEENAAPSNPTPGDYETNESYQQSDWKDPANGWYDDPQGVTDEMGFEWIAKRVRSWVENEDGSGQNVWGPFSEPTLWSNKSVSIKEVIAQYAISEGGENDDQPSESEWYDSSPNVTNEKPYLWKRSKYIFTDGSDSDAWVYEVIGKMGDKGIDGESIEYIYKLTEENSKPKNPTPSNYKTNSSYQQSDWKDTANGWYDDPQTMIGDYKFQWVAVRNKKHNEETGEMEWGPFSEPSLWSERYPGLFIHIKYAVKADEDEVGAFVAELGLPGTILKLTSNNGEDVGTYIGILTDYTEGDSDDPTDYTWKKFEGEDGFSREYIFKLANKDEDGNGPLLPTDNDPTTEQYCPAGWARDPQSPNPTLKYCWACHRDKENGLWGDWKGTGNSKYAYLFSMFAESVPGATGQQGPILYPLGEWKANTSYSQHTKTIKDENGNENVIATATPYVLYGKDYYVLNVFGPVTSNPSTDTTSWLKMDKFNAIYAEILLANNALVGSAVFNGDYIFSQQGIGSGTYENFNHDSPYAPGNVFKPNWCVNLNTGEMWTGAGKSHFASNGSGFLANENISWDTNGNLIIGGNEFNNNGSGSLASGKISWESNGEAVIGGFKINNSSIGLSDKTFRRWAEINTDGTFTFGTQQSSLFGTDISDISFDGEMLTIEKSNLGGSNNVPTTNAFMISHGNVVFRVSNAGVYANKNGKEYDLLSLLDKMDDLEDSEGVQFVDSVDSIPPDAKEGTLYVI